MTEIRDEHHWIYERHTQRVTRKQWQQILLEGEDKIIFRGRLRTLRAKCLGAGVYEIYKVPLKED